jgi:hypothetical protein
MRPAVVDGLIRHRNWVVSGVLVVAVMIVVAVAANPRGAAAGVGVRFGALLKAPAGASINLTNAWIASSGSDQIAVYAGSQLQHPRNGLLIIMRRSSTQKLTRTPRTLPGSGAVTLLRPPHFSSEQAAGTATLNFVTASGDTGTLDLSTDAVKR